VAAALPAFAETTPALSPITPAAVLTPVTKLCPLPASMSCLFEAPPLSPVPGAPE